MPRWGRFSFVRTSVWPGGGSDVPEILASPDYIVRGYSAVDRIVYGTGGVTPRPPSLLAPRCCWTTRAWPMCMCGRRGTTVFRFGSTGGRKLLRARWVYRARCRRGHVFTAYSSHTLCVLPCARLTGVNRNGRNRSGAGRVGASPDLRAPEWTWAQNLRGAVHHVGDAFGPRSGRLRRLDPFQRATPDGFRRGVPEGALNGGVEGRQQVIGGDQGVRRRSGNPIGRALAISTLASPAGSWRPKQRHAPHAPC